MSIPAWKTIDHFWEQIEPTGFCWLWKGGISTAGYGYFWFDGTNYPAHRLSYMELVGPIPDGLHIDHLCRVRNCVNPDHLEPVTQEENSRRGNIFKMQRDMCFHGHLWTAANTLPLGHSIRCRQCILVRTHQKRGKACEYDRFCSMRGHLETREGVAA